ncbi:hypothetical protein LLG07_00055 [bacterium]|nr:hypothetical protein [bacterium]
MIKEVFKPLSKKEKLQNWHLVYFYLPRIIEVDKKFYRVYREWVYARVLRFADIYSDEQWEYKFINGGII